MPNRVKALLSLAVLLTALVVHAFQLRLGQPLTPWLVLFVGAVMIIALWLFPEAKKPMRRGHGGGRG